MTSRATLTPTTHPAEYGLAGYVGMQTTYIITLDGIIVREDSDEATAKRWLGIIEKQLDRGL